MSYMDPHVDSNVREQLIRNISNKTDGGQIFRTQHRKNKSLLVRIWFVLFGCFTQMWMKGFGENYQWSNFWWNWLLLKQRKWTTRFGHWYCMVLEERKLFLNISQRSSPVLRRMFHLSLIAPVNIIYYRDRLDESSLIQSWPTSASARFGFGQNMCIFLEYNDILSNYWQQ